ncbi:MAG: tetratricopeptide repeat protein [Xanthomonadales bacterium]|nr:tetratricopeptide repeat protein [Xanthomonadales bacterium]
MSLFKDLIERRVLYIAGIYLGIIFAAFEFTGIAVERYGFSDQLVDLVLAGMLAMLPTVILLAWFHGKPGKDQWGRVEKVGVPLNVVGTVALLLWLAPGQKVEAISETRTVLDESGQEFTLEVARADLVQQLAVFFLEPQGFPTENPWEAYAASLLISEAADKDPLINTYIPYRFFRRGLIWKLRRAGYDSGLGAPVSLLQELAELQYQDHFVAGSISPAGGGYSVNMELYQTRPLKKLADYEFTGSDLYRVAEQASLAIKNEMNKDHPVGRVSETSPVEDLFTDDIQALELYVRGLNARMLDNDDDQAVDWFTRAVEVDPNFAMAYQALTDVYDARGDFARALEYLKEVNRLSHRFSDVQRILDRGRGYRFRNQNDKARQVYQMWTELEPENYQAWQTLGSAYFWSGNMTGQAIEAYEKSLELMPNQDWILSQLAGLYKVEGRMDDAISVLQRQHELRPSSYQPLIALGDIETQRGNLEQAAEYFQQGAVAQTDMVTPILRLADNQASRGNLDEAFAHLDDADFVAQAPRQQSAVVGERSGLRMMMGQPRAALRLFKQRLALEAVERSSLDLTMMHMQAMALYAMAGEIEEAESVLASIGDMFRPPFDFVPSIGWMMLDIYRERYDSALEHNQRLLKGMTTTGRDDLVFITEFTEGVIMRERGDIDGALAKLKNSQVLHDVSIQQLEEEGIQFRNAIAVELARTQVLAGLPDDALQTLENMLASWPYNPDANLEAARAYLALDDIEAARGALNRAMTLWSEAEPDYRPAMQARELADQLN